MRRMNLFSNKRGQEEWFKVGETADKRKMKIVYKNKEHMTNYTIMKSKKYNRKTDWSKKICEQLVDEIESDSDEVVLTLKAIDGRTVYFRAFHKNGEVVERRYDQ